MLLSEETVAGNSLTEYHQLRDVGDLNELILTAIFR